jgi:hypothetical protein
VMDVPEDEQTKEIYGGFQGCGWEQPRYNSCRNRHCPGCQALRPVRWLEARRERIVNTGYFHGDPTSQRTANLTFP